MRATWVVLFVLILATSPRSFLRAEEIVRLNAKEVSSSPSLGSIKPPNIAKKDASRLDGRSAATDRVQVTALDLSPDGSVLAVGSKPPGPFCVLGGSVIDTGDGLIHVIDAKTLKSIKIIDPRKWPASEVEPIALRFLSGTAKLSTLCREGVADKNGAIKSLNSLSLFDVPEGRLLRRIESGTGEDWRIPTLSKDATRFATLTHSGMRIWDVESGAELRRLPDMLEEPTSIEFSLDSKVLAVGNSHGEIGLWDLRSSRRIGSFKPRYSKGEPFGVSFLTFSPDGSMLVCGVTVRREIEEFLYEYASELRLIELGTMSERESLQGRIRHVTNSAAFSPDAKTLVSVSCVPGESRGVVSIWDLATLTERASVGDARAVSLVKFFHGGRSLLTADREWLVIRELATGRDRAELYQGEPNLASPGVDVAFSPDGKTIASSNGRLRIWNIEAALQPATEGGHRSRVTCLAFFPDGLKLASGGYDRTVKLWDIRKREVSRSLIGHQAEVVQVAISSNGSRVASMDAKGVIRVWDSSLGDCLLLVQGPKERSRQLRFGPGDRTLILMSGSTGDRWRVDRWDTANGSHLLLPEIPAAGSSAEALSTDGSLYLSQSEQSVELRSVETGRLQSAFSAREQSVGFVVQTGGTTVYEMTPNESIFRHSLVGSKWASARIRRGDDNEFTLGNHLAGDSMALSSNGRIFAYNSNGTIRYHDSITQEWLSIQKAWADTVERLALSRSGELMAVSQASGDIWILSLPIK